MTEKQKIDLLYFLDVYKDDLIINMTDKRLYDDPWQKSDINLLNKDITKTVINANIIDKGKLKYIKVKTYVIVNGIITFAILICNGVL